MEFRIFRVKFENDGGDVKVLMSKLIKNLKKDQENYNQQTQQHQKDIQAIASNKRFRGIMQEVREAATQFAEVVKGTESFKRIGNIIRFKYYTDEVEEGMQPRFTTYADRLSVSKTHPKFLQTFILYVFSKEEGVLFAPSLRSVKVNRMLSKDLGKLLLLRSFNEVRFDSTNFETVLNKVMTEEPDTIVQEVNSIGAKIKDKELGKCYVSFDMTHKVSYQQFQTFKKRYLGFFLKQIVFTTRIDSEDDSRKIRISLLADKHPLHIELRVPFSLYAPLFTWLGNVFIEISG